jgi:flagellar biosynthesis/type III secretory pathway protein FliH
MKEIFDLVKMQNLAFLEAFESGKRIGYCNGWKEGYNAKTEEVEKELDRQNELMKKENDGE